MERVIATEYIKTPAANSRPQAATVSILLGSGLLFVLLYNVTDLTTQELVALTISFYTIITYIDTLGEYINIPELTLAFFSFELLFMPVVAYNYRPSDMVIEKEFYFNFVIPAMLAMSIGYKVTNLKNRAHHLVVQKAKDYIQQHSETPRKLFYVGLSFCLLAEIVPTELKAIMTLFANCLYISVLYNYLLDNKKSLLIPAVVIGIMLYQIVKSGMFGNIFMWALMWAPYLLLNTTIGKSRLFKFMIVFVVFVSLPVIQGVKYQYRLITWNKDRLEKDNDTSLLLTLFSARIENYTTDVDADIMYESFTRLNQGILLAKAMNYVPHYEPYANGEVLLHFFYPFIPRLIWPDKPITGGKKNMLRYTGIDNGDVNSSNISPLGEAYVNFGTIGGVFFMLFYGLLFGYIYKCFFSLSAKSPTLFLWVPTAFMASAASDTDVLSIWGTCATAIVFLALVHNRARHVRIYI